MQTRMRMRRFVAAVLAAVFTTQAMAAGPQCARSGVKEPPTQLEYESCKKVCLIRYSPGGLIERFKADALRLRAQGRLMVIDGECISACTVAADRARPNACITPRATLHFHKQYVWDVKGCFIHRSDMYHDYSAEFAAWVRGKGGFPGDDLQDNALLKMSNAEASAFFPRCA